MENETYLLWDLVLKTKSYIQINSFVIYLPSSKFVSPSICKTSKYVAAQFVAIKTAWLSAHHVLFSLLYMDENLDLTVEKGVQ